MLPADLGPPCLSLGPPCLSIAEPAHPPRTAGHPGRTVHVVHNNSAAVCRSDWSNRRLAHSMTATAGSVCSLSSRISYKCSPPSLSLSPWTHATPLSFSLSLSVDTCDSSDPASPSLVPKRGNTLVADETLLRPLMVDTRDGWGVLGKEALLPSRWYARQATRLAQLYVAPRLFLTLA